MGENYRGLEELRYAALDAVVIITGAEPRSPDLTSEPYWGELTQLMDWSSPRRHFGALFVPCGACGGAASRRHPAPAPAPKAFRGLP